MSLKQLKVNESGTIVGLGGDHREAAKLIALGVLPGLRVKLVQRTPSYVFEIGHSQFAVDAAIASQILVERT